MLTASDVRDQLRARARQLGTQRHLATDIGISEQYLCDILHGRREPTVRELTYLGLITTIIRRPRRPRKHPRDAA